jgi:thiol-disulfide isomerase/thioredoxin
MKSQTPLAAAAAALAAVAAAVVISGRHAPDKTACPAASLAVAAKLRPLAGGDLAALAVNPVLAQKLSFMDADGAKRTLADFKGRAVVLNLWATWCVPCRAEMPALDALQAQAGGPDFEVVAVNVDTARVERASKFLDEIGVTHLAHYADHSGDAFETLRLAGKALGLPTSLLIDKDGCEIGVVAGPANWGSAQAVELAKVMRGG